MEHNKDCAAEFGGSCFCSLPPSKPSLTPEEQAIVNAWLVEGKVPKYHQQQIARLRHDWPVLHLAITRLIVKSRQANTA